MVLARFIKSGGFGRGNLFITPNRLVVAGLIGVMVDASSIRVFKVLS
jgi:hypothetical protein